MDIGSRLDKAMLAAGYRAQSALSQASGISKPTINRILKGKGKYPDALTIYRLAKVCGVSVEWLVAGDDATGQTAVHLAYITSKEANLLTHYRLCDEEGKEAIFIAAETVRQVSPAAPE